MKRRKRKSEVRGMLYGCLGPAPEDRERVLELHRIGHQYRDVLWEIYDRHRRDYVRVRDELCGPRMGELEERLARAKEDQDREAIRDTQSRIRVLRKSMTPVARAKLDAFAVEQQVHRQAEIKAARAQSGVYHATYQLLEKAAMEAALRPVPARKRPPWNGLDGKLGVAAAPIAVSEALGGRGRWLRVDVQSGIVQFRVGSEQDRSPVWASYRCTLRHARPLPPDGVIRAAWVKARRVGVTEEWSLGFAVELERGFSRRPPARRKGHATVTIGFEGFEACRAVVARVGREPVVYDATPRAPRQQHRGQRKGEPVPRLEHARQIAQQASRNYDQALDALKEWADGASLPRWLKLSLDDIPRWTGPRYLQDLVALWRGRRLDGDETIFRKLAAWSTQDRHLREWCDRERARSLRNRREQYRVAATSIARSYESITLIRGDLRDRSMSDDRKDVALSELCDAIKLACENYRCNLTVASDADSAIAQSAE